MLIKSLIRLWNYLNIYYLKPFDAVNDTITSDLLLKLNWQNNYIEIGSGDGAFSFIMHGGSFSLYYDRYLNVNLNKKDIFNSNNKNLVIKKKYKKEKIFPSISIDAKKFHVDLVKKIGFSKKTILSKYENLPIKYPKIPPSTEPTVAKNANLHTLEGFAKHIGANITSGGIGKKEDSATLNTNK